MAMRKQQIGNMFDKAAARYDVLNTLLSAGMDKRWRRTIAKAAAAGAEDARILDVATGTGMVAFEIKKLLPDAMIVGLDYSLPMLELAKNELGKRCSINRRQISLVRADSETMPFPDSRFDVVTVSFGIRNMEDRVKALNEFFRVLGNQGKLIILEFGIPQNTLIRGLYLFYFTKILPRIGNLISGSKHAYSYLPDSVLNFPENHDFIKMLELAGFFAVKVRMLTFGIVNMFYAIKSPERGNSE